MVLPCYSTKFWHCSKFLSNGSGASTFLACQLWSREKLEFDTGAYKSCQFKCSTRLHAEWLLLCPASWNVEAPAFSRLQNAL